jgi:tRNA modification GTPase
VIDEIVLTYFKGPNSYNGEDILELAVHGNPINVRRIIELFKRSGVREANPGEITYRALRNNKMTLTQVEGLDTLLNAGSIDLFDNGMSHLNGELQKEYLNLRESYLGLRGSIEILIDFSDDVGEEQSNKLFKDHFENFKNLIHTLKRRTRSPRSHLLKPKVVLMGVTNAGKSTLFNKLLEEKRSIVSEIKGTTRDYISEYFSHKGAEFQVVDTAGLRESEDKIEVEGIKLSIELFSDAFYKILVINPFLSDELGASALEADAVVFTHSDLEGFAEKIYDFNELSAKSKRFSLGPIGPLVELGPIGPKSETGPIGPESKTGPIGPEVKTGPIGPEAKTGPIGPEVGGPIEPLGLLKDQIYSKYSMLMAEKPILPDRQRNIINNLSDMVEGIAQLIEGINDPAIISNEINMLDGEVNGLLGITTSDDVLNNIFSNFCIGK